MQFALARETLTSFLSAKPNAMFHWQSDETGEFCRRHHIPARNAVQHSERSRELTDFP